jgi:hypothetical protein
MFIYVFKFISNEITYNIFQIQITGAFLYFMQLPNPANDNHYRKCMIVVKHQIGIFPQLNQEKLHFEEMMIMSALYSGPPREILQGGTVCYFIRYEFEHIYKHGSPFTFLIDSLPGLRIVTNEDQNFHK